MSLFIGQASTDKELNSRMKCMDNEGKPVLLVRYVVNIGKSQSEVNISFTYPKHF